MHHVKIINFSLLVTLFVSLLLHAILILWTQPTINELLSNNISRDNTPVMDISLIPKRPDSKITVSELTPKKKRQRKTIGKRSSYAKHKAITKRRRRVFDTEKLLGSVRRSHARQLQPKQYLSFSHKSVNSPKKPLNQNFYNPLNLRGQERSNGTIIASQRTGDGRALITLKRKNGRKTCFVVARPNPFDELNANPWMFTSQCK